MASKIIEFGFSKLLHTYFSKSKTQIHRKKRDDNRFSLKGYINLACESFQRLKGCIAITNSKDVLNVKYCQTKQLLNTEILKEIKISKTGNFAETMEKLQALKTIFPIVMMKNLLCHFCLTNLCHFYI